MLLITKPPARGVYLFCAAICGYLLITPLFKPWAELGWHDSQRILQIALLGLAGLLVLVDARLSTSALDMLQRISPGMRWALGLALGLALLSAQRAAMPRMALLEVSHYVLLFHTMIVVAACRVLAGKLFDRIALATLVLFGIFYSTAVLAALLSAYSGAGLNVYDLFSGNGFDNLRFFGQAQTLTLPIFGALLLVLKKPGHRLGLFVLLSFWWAFSITAGTRSTWLGMLAALCVAPLIGKPGWRWVRWMVLSLVCGIAIYWMLILLPDWSGNTVRIYRLSNLTQLSARDIIWMQAWETITRQPWLGIGPMHLALAPNGVAAHPHNAPLQWAAEMGVPFALILTGSILAGYFHLFNAARRESSGTDQALLMGLFLSLVAAGAHAMVDGIHVMPYSQTLLVLVAGWAMGFTATPAVNTISQRLRALGVGYALLVIAALSVLAYCVYPDIANLAERESANVMLAPRFWRLGWLTW